MSNKWFVETTKFGTIHFISDNGSSIFVLHDKQLDEAMKIATEFGYRPRSFFRPSTWGNVCIAFDEQVSDSGKPARAYYAVPVAQQKQILNQLCYTVFKLEKQEKKHD